MNEKLENYRYFSTSIIFLILSNVISILIRMGSRIIIARFSSVDLYGLYSVIWNEMTFVSTIALLGLGQQLTITLPREGIEDKKKSIISALSFSAIIGLITLITSILLYVFQINTTYKYSILISTFFILFLFVQFMFIGLKDFLGYFIQTVIQSTTMFIMIIILRKILTIDILVYITFGSIGFSIIISIIYLLTKTKSSIKSFSFSEIKIFKFSKKQMSLFLVDIVNSIILYLLLKLPQLIVGNYLAGYINVAFSIIAFLMILPQILAAIVGPKISEDYFTSRFTSLNNSFKTSLSLLYFLQGILIIIFSYLGNFFLKILYGIEYLSGSRIIFFGFILVAIIDSLNYPYAIYIRNTDHEGLFAIGKIISLTIFVLPALLLLFFLENYLSLAIPIAYLISVTSLLTFYFFYTIKLNIELENKDIKKLLFWLAIILISAILAFISNNYILSEIYLFLICLGNIILFIVILILLKIINVKLLFRDAKEIISILKARRKKNNTNSEIQSENSSI